MDGLSGYYRTEQVTIHCLPSCILACLHTRARLLPAVCQSVFCISFKMTANLADFNMAANE